MMTTAAAVEDDRSIRQAERADLLAVVRIERISFPQPWPYDAFETFLGEPGFLVATDRERVAGYVVADQTDGFGYQHGHVKDFAVHPDVRGQGVGSALLTCALRTLAINGAATVKLEVRESNEGAKRLYRSFDFEPIRRVDGYYEGGEDAIVMVRTLG